MRIKIGNIVTLKEKTQISYGNGYSTTITSIKQKQKELSKASKFATYAFFELTQLVSDVRGLCGRHLFFSHQFTELQNQMTSKLDYMVKHKENRFPNFSHYYFGGCLFIINTLKKILCKLKELFKSPKIATNIWNCNMLLERIVLLESKYRNYGFDESDTYANVNVSDYHHDMSGTLQMKAI